MRWRRSTATMAARHGQAHQRRSQSRPGPSSVKKADFTSINQRALNLEPQLYKPADGFK